MQKILFPTFDTLVRPVAEEGELHVGEELDGDVDAAGHQGGQESHPEHHHPPQAVLQLNNQKYLPIIQATKKLNFVKKDRRQKNRKIKINNLPYFM